MINAFLDQKCIDYVHFATTWARKEVIEDRKKVCNILILMRNRFFSPPLQSYFLFGPRGTGKSTFLKQTYPQAYTIDLLLADNYQKYLAHPDRLAQVCQALPPEATVVIDEVQRVPALLSVVHHVMEKQKDLQFILTGSSSRKLKRAGVDLLAGRALRRELHPYLLSEIGDVNSLDPYLERGLLPLVVEAKEPAETLASYISLYINDEVKAEGLVRNLDSFARFLESISFANAKQYNVSEISRECGVSRTSITSYIEILEDLLLCFVLPVFSARAKRKLVVSKKFYFFDVGVYQSIRPRGTLAYTEQIGGAALETLIAQHLRAWVAYSGAKNGLYYWRTQAGNEVDFVLYGEHVFSAFEVKQASTVRRSDLSGLKSFREDYPTAKLFLIYLGDEPLVIDGITCVPAIRFLKDLQIGKNPME